MSVVVTETRRRPYPTCVGCGSTLLPSRYEGPSLFAGELVDVWRCGCGRRRRFPRTTNGRALARPFEETLRRHNRGGAAER